MKPPNRMGSPMTTSKNPHIRATPKRSLAVRSAAAKVAVKAAEKQGKTPKPGLVELAQAT